MADLLKNLQGFLQLDEISIDNNIFRLHYKVTGVLLIACSLLVTERQYLGDPIDCITDKVPASLMDTYCWIHSTYTVTNLSNAIIGVEVPHPGIAPPLDLFSDTERRYHKYYQWVTLVLFFQALMFYLPRYLWKTWERNKMKHLVMQLNKPVLDDEVRSTRKQILCDYYLKNLHEHKDYAFKFFFCEVLNMVNVLMQIYITDFFLGGTFTSYGSQVIEFSRKRLGTRHDPMDEVFPKVTKCTFHKYGPSGTVQRVDGLCVLPINVLNEKIYIVLWFWFIILAAITGISLLYRLGTFSSAFRNVLLRTKSQLADQASVDNVVKLCDIGDWFVVYQLAKNMDPLIFAEVIEALSEKCQDIYSTETYERADTLPSKRTLKGQSLALSETSENYSIAPN